MRRELTIIHLLEDSNCDEEVVEEEKESSSDWMKEIYTGCY